MHNHQFGFLEFLIEETFETFELHPLASSLTRLKTVSYFFFESNYLLFIFKLLVTECPKCREQSTARRKV